MIPAGVKLPCIKKEFRSWSEFLTYCETEPSLLPEEKRHSRVEDGMYKSFTGCKNWQEVLKLAHEGWQQGEQRIANVSGPLFTHVSKMIERVEVSHDVEGHSIDVARYVEGEPECWLKFEDVLQEAESGNKLIRIVFNCCVSGAIDKQTIFRKGAAIASLVELLEYAGHRVELTLADATTAGFPGSDPAYKVFVRVKDFDQPLDMSLIAYALAHPSVLRALMFSFSETLPEAHLKALEVHYNGGYGRVSEIAEDERGDIYIGGSSSHEPQWYDDETAENWVISQLRKQGIHINTKLKG